MVISGIIVAPWILYDLDVYGKLNKQLAMFFMLFALASFVKSSFGVESDWADPMLNPYASFIGFSL